MPLGACAPGGTRWADLRKLCPRIAGARFALAVFKGLGHLAPHPHILHLPNERFSRDQTVVEAMKEDPLIARKTQPAETMAALVRADERACVDSIAPQASGESTSASS